MKPEKTELPMLSFQSQQDWEEWLEDNHDRSSGIWVRFFKKHAQVPSITYADAVISALCYGWIDSQVKKFDEQSYLQKFTPRRPKSLWSKVNTGHIERLIAEGKMKPAGLKEVEEAKNDGRWEAAYNSPSNAVVPEDFLENLAKNKKAESFFKTLNKTNTYAIVWRLQTAKKAETRERRMHVIIDMLARGEKFY